MIRVFASLDELVRLLLQIVLEAQYEVHFPTGVFGQPNRYGV